jgi:putative redox protein
VSKPPTVVELTWERDLVFAGRSGSIALTLDSESAAGPSPMQAVAFGLAGCMAIDLVHILKKGRHDVRALRANLTGHRAADEPRRFTTMSLHYTLSGNVAADHVQRAIQLSRDKYCSVWHSLRQDITLDITFSIEPGA